MKRQPRTVSSSGTTWQRITTGTYAEHNAAGTAYALHVDALELIEAHPPPAKDRDYWTPRRVCLRAFAELRDEGVEGLIIGHPNGIESKLNVQ